MEITTRGFWTLVSCMRIAGFLGAILDENAPVDGSEII
jgi:hypothetical protein